LIYKAEKTAFVAISPYNAQQCTANVGKVSTVIIYSLPDYLSPQVRQESTKQDNMAPDTTQAPDQNRWESNQMDNEVKKANGLD